MPTRALSLTAALSLLGACASPVTLRNGIEIAVREAPDTVPTSAEEGVWYAPRESGIAMSDLVAIIDRSDPLPSFDVFLVHENTWTLTHVSVDRRNGRVLESNRDPMPIGFEDECRAFMTRARAMPLSVLDAIAIAEAYSPSRPTRAYRLSDDALSHDVLLGQDGKLLAVRVDSAGAVIETRDVPSLEEFMDPYEDEDDSWDPEE